MISYTSSRRVARRRNDEDDIDDQRCSSFSGGDRRRRRTRKGEEEEEERRARGETIRRIKKGRKRKEEVRARGPKEDQPVTILSHVGHRRPQTGHRIPMLATGGRKWSGRSFYSENRPIFCKTFFSGRGLPHSRTQRPRLPSRGVLGSRIADAGNAWNADGERRLTNR